MTQKEQFNVTIKAETRKMIDQLCQLTYHRLPADVIEWLVAEAYARIEEMQRADVTVEEAQTAGCND